MRRLALRVPRPTDFTSRLRSPATAARVGVWLAVAFVVCFVTGLVSHYAQEPHQPVPFPTGPAWGYRLTQGLHVTSGAAAVPLLLVKLWTVFPRLFERPPLRRGGRLVLHVLERASIAVLVAAAVFQLATGLMNAAQWYPWAFSFRGTHHSVAWLAIGALLVHVAVKLPVVRDVLGTHVDDTAHDSTGADVPGALGRRALLRTTWAAAGLAVLTTVGASVPWLRKVSVFGVRSGDGPAGIPINRSARAADAVAGATHPGWRLAVVVDGRQVAAYTRAELLAMPQREEELPIACVEGWSASGRWGGVPVRALLEGAGAPTDRDVVVDSEQRVGAFSRSTLQANFVADERTLVALHLEGETLSLDHGYPARLIAPNRPGVLQTKWLAALEVST